MLDILFLIMFVHLRCLLLPVNFVVINNSVFLLDATFLLISHNIYIFFYRYGHNFASKNTPRHVKVKNAQEAHEAIRPTNIRRLPCNFAYYTTHSS